MPDFTHLSFTTTIAAPPERVHRLTIDPAAYRRWTAAFCEGSTFEGSWNEGERIRFVGPSGDGMLSEIARHEPGRFVSIRHLGMVLGGVEDTTGDAARAWAGALENYRYEPVPGGTRMTVEQDMAPEHAAFMTEAWPRALATLKALCEDEEPA